MQSSKNGKPSRILLVASDGKPESAITRALSGLGLSLDLAADGASALECCEKTAYSLVIVKLEVPASSPLFFVQLLKLRQPRIPVLVVSEPLSMADQATALRWGVTDCLAPTLIRELPARIAGYVGPSRT